MKKFIIHITSGQGPVECEQAVGHLKKAMLRDAKMWDITLEELSLIKGSIRDSYKSITFTVHGSETDSFVTSWSGVICWVCKSRLRSECKRKRWYIRIHALELEQSSFLENAEFRFETCKSSGPGGQHVNKVETSVRITEKSSGISILASEERSQYRNKQQGLERLKRLLQKLDEDSIMSQEKLLWSKHHADIRGTPTRVFYGDTFKEKKHG